MEGAYISHETPNLLVGEVEAERRHAGFPEGRAAVLDDLDKIVVREGVHGAGVGKIPGAKEEQVGPPRISPARDAVTGGAMGPVKRRTWSSVRRRPPLEDGQEPESNSASKDSDTKRDP